MNFVLGFLFLACLYTTGHSQEEREFSVVTITESVVDDTSPFANILLDTLVKKPILDESSASRILATFNVKGVNRNTDNAQAYTKTTIGTMALKGDAEAAKNFINRLTGLFDIHDKQGERLIEYCMELILDNNISEPNDLAQLAAGNGYGVKITTTKSSVSTQEIEGNPASPTAAPTLAPTAAPTAAPTTAPPDPIPAEKDCSCPVWASA